MSIGELLQTPANGTNPTSMVVNKSVMRTFLEDLVPFSWPDDHRRKSDFYMFDKDHTMYDLLRSERNLSSSKSREEKEKPQVVGQYRVKSGKSKSMGFAEAFAVKRTTQPPDDYEQSTREVNAMRGLRFPHVSALLGNFWHDGLIYIATYPAGHGDLGDFLHCVSKKLEQEKGGAPWQAREGLAIVEQDYLKYFQEPLETQMRRLEGWFLCLSTALEYLHNSKVRHRDIKPENIIIDHSGMVVLVDFGISTKFPDGTDDKLSTTSLMPDSTSRYQPWEVYCGLERDYRSDVWSMGCVFLEMISPLFGMGTSECKENCSNRNPKTGNHIEEYCVNLRLVTKWIEVLRSHFDYFRGTADRNRVNTALRTIAKMLNNDKELRPTAKDLWKSFDLQEGKCPDCYPESNTKWDPSTHQQTLHKEAEPEREQLMKELDAQEEELMKIKKQARIVTDTRRLSGHYGRAKPMPLPAPARQSPTRVAFEAFSREPELALQRPQSPGGSPAQPQTAQRSPPKIRRDSFNRRQLQNLPEGTFDITNASLHLTRSRSSSDPRRNQIKAPSVCSSGHLGTQREGLRGHVVSKVDEGPESSYEVDKENFNPIDELQAPAPRLGKVIVTEEKSSLIPNGVGTDGKSSSQSQGWDPQPLPNDSHGSNNLPMLDTNSESLRSDPVTPEIAIHLLRSDTIQTIIEDPVVIKKHSEAPKLPPESSTIVLPVVGGFEQQLKSMPSTSRASISSIEAIDTQPKSSIRKTEQEVLGSTSQSKLTNGQPPPRAKPRLPEEVLEFDLEHRARKVKPAESRLVEKLPHRVFFQLPNGGSRKFTVYSAEKFLAAFEVQEPSALFRFLALPRGFLEKSFGHQTVGPSYICIHWGDTSPFESTPKYLLQEKTSQKIDALPN